jgi:phage nucleotide-binding protein
LLFTKLHFFVTPVNTKRQPESTDRRETETEMAIKLKQTKDLHLSGVKICIYGQAGAGKTSLIPTLPNPVVLSAEGGLLSIREANIPYIEITCMDDLREAYKWLMTAEEAKGFESVALDSISEVAEVVLTAEKKSNNRDGRAAYGEMSSIMTDLIRSFRDLPGRHVLMTAKLEKSQDEMGRMLYNPSMPGKTLTQGLPYFFDEMFALRVERDAEGVAQRALLCQPDGLWYAKDRSGVLDTWESPDLGAIIQKIGGKNV